MYATQKSTVKVEGQYGPGGNGNIRSGRSSRQQQQWSRYNGKTRSYI